VGSPGTHLRDDGWRLLPAPDDSLRADDTRLGVDRAVDHVYAQNVRAARIRVFVPHANNHLGPRMAEASSAVVCEFGALAADVLVVVGLGEEMHDEVVR
jgi:hypothetical protein